MKTLISSSVISKSHPASKPYEVRDTRVKGFLLRIQPSGAKTFYVEYRRGKRKRLGSADVIQPDKARTEARKILAAAYEGVDPDVQSRKSLVRTLKDYIDRVYEPWAIGQVGDLYYSIAQETGSQDEFKKARFWSRAALEQFYSRHETERFTDEYFWYLPRARNLITMYRKGLGGDVDQDEGNRFGEMLNFLVFENERKSEYEEEMRGKLTEYSNDLGGEADPGWSEDEQLE